MGLVTPVEPVPLHRLGRVHFVGIGGVGMSGVARVMVARGVRVSGSEIVPSPVLADLAALGADVHLGHSVTHLDGVDTVVVSTAIRPDNVELVEARRRGLRVVHRAAALAALMLDRRATAVAGTHGKTTTTAMLTTILRGCGADPGYVIGGVLAETGLSAADGTGRDFVVEADESDGSFVMLPAHAAVVTNVDADHLDNYSCLDEITAAFVAFTRRVAPDGPLIVCVDDPGARVVADAARRRSLRVRGYGESSDAAYRIRGVRRRGMGVDVELTATGTPFGRYEGVIAAAVPGRHNAFNATAAFAAAVELGFPPRDVAAALATYRGARRRMEPKGDADGVRVFDSYAHHPTELAADLAAARDLAAGGRVIAVFQPHLVSRTRIFARRFGVVLAEADEVIVLDVYPAREDPDPAVTGRLVADAVPGGRALYAQLPDRVPEIVADLAKPGDVVLTMGAGDVTRLGPAIVAALHARAAAPTAVPHPTGGASPDRGRDAPR